MLPRYMLDTNMASYVIRGNLPQVRTRLLAVPLGSTCLSVVSEAELRFGVARKGHPEKLARAVEEFLIRIDRLPWNSRTAEIYATLRAIQEDKGRPLGALDTLIAAHALAEGTVLVTNDAAFGSVAGLVVEDWARPA